MEGLTIKHYCQRRQVQLLLLGTILLVVHAARVRGEPVSAEALGTHPELSGYLAYAALHNSGLEAAFNRWQAAVEKAPQAKALPDPRFTYAYFIEEVETRVGPQEQKFGLTQMFPWFGTLQLRGNVAMEEAKAAYERYQAEKLRLFYRVKKAFYEFYYVGRAIAITEDNIELLKRFESVAQAQYRGGASISGVIKAQVELGKLDERVRSLRDLRTPLSARLNAAMNRPASDLLPWPTNAPLRELELPEKELFSRLVTDNPELKSLDALITKEREGIALARKAYFPDFMVGVDYIDTGGALMAGTPDSGKDPVIGMIGVDLPVWWWKNKAGVQEARRRHRAAVAQRAEREKELEAEIAMAFYRFRDAARKIRLFRDTLIPQAEEALFVTEESYRAGKVDFLSLIDAERLLLEFQLSYEQALSEREQRLAKIEMLTGQEFSNPEKKHEDQ